MKSRTHVVARDSASAVMDEYHHNRERAVATLRQRFSVRLQQVEQKLKRDLRELKDGELQKVYAPEQRSCSVTPPLPRFSSFWLHQVRFGAKTRYPGGLESGERWRGRRCAPEGEEVFN